MQLFNFSIVFIKKIIFFVKNLGINNQEREQWAKICKRELITIPCTLVQALIIKIHKKENRHLPVFFIVSLLN